MTPSWRKPAGTLLIVMMITVWAVLIATLADTVIGWPIALQTLFYLATGLVWIAPLGPLLKWMETGRWR